MKTREFISHVRKEVIIVVSLTRYQNGVLQRHHLWLIENKYC